MLRSFTRIPIRRYIHTPRRPLPPNEGSPIRLVIGLAATVAAVTYFSGWNYPRKVTDVPLVSAHKTTPSASDEASESTPSHSPENTDSNPPELPVTDDAISPETSDSSQDEESSGGAFNPVTGEINWDCPCLGGMAHGLCGPQFREAFSCFVFSEKEPKGIDCVEKFKSMQDCFREHPDIYGDEIMEDDEDDAADSDEADLSTEGSAEEAVPPTEAKQDDLPQTHSPSLS